MPVKWALLIGVDFYFQGDKRKVHFEHLKGCVRDVSRIEKYLKSINVHNVEKLTASYDNNDDKPKETDESTWPTYDNVKTRFKAIRDQVKPGDLVYIHYSGHGILRQELKDIKNYTTESGGDAVTGTALALTNVMAGGAYLTGYQLGVWVKGLVKKKGVRVAITLDSCYSGEGLRNGNGFALRTSCDGKVDDTVLEGDLLADNEARAQDISLGSNESGSEERNAKIKLSWLSNPEGCTVLTACQLNQEAGEYRFGTGKEREGILTHWMMDIVHDLRPGIRPPTYASVAQHVKSKITLEMNRKQPQTPVLHGDSLYEFFSDQQHIQRPTCLVTALDQPGTHEKTFEVDVGYAQGVATGAIYSVYPSSWSSQPEEEATSPQQSDTKDAKIPPKIRIDKVFTFYSNATLIGENNTPEMAIVTGSLAVLETWSFATQQLVGFSQLPKQQSTDEIQKLMNKTAEMPNFLSSPLGCDNKNSPQNFAVSLDHETRNCTITDGEGVRVPRVPAISMDDESAETKVAYILNHLARFKALEAVQNHNHSEASSSQAASNYKLELLRVDKNRTVVLESSEGTYEVTDSMELKIRFVNETDNDNVHVAIFLFNATWGVEKVFPEDGQPMAQAAANKKLTYELEMEIPPGAHPDDLLETRDRFRAFVYIGDNPPSWDELVLPDIPADSSLVPTILQVEPVVQEDDDGHKRNMKKRNKPPVKKQEQATTHKEWTVLEFCIHTKKD